MRVIENAIFINKCYDSIFQKTICFLNFRVLGQPDSAYGYMNEETRMTLVITIFFIFYIVFAI